MDIDSKTQELSGVLRELLHTIEIKQTAAAERGELFVLSYICSRSCPVQPSEISAAMGVSSARVAAVLRALAGRGLIARTGDCEDHRRVDIHLTQAGCQYIAAYRAGAQNKIKRLINELGENDTEEYLRLTRRIIQISQSINGDDAGGDGNV